VTKRGVILGDLLQPVKRGDGLVFDRGVAEEGEEGGSVWEMHDNKGRKIQGVAGKGGNVELVFGPHQVFLQNISKGDLVWKNSDPVLEGEIRKTYEGLSAAASRKVPVAVAVSGAIGKPLQLQLTDDQGLVAVADTGEVLLQPAKQRVMSERDVVEGVGQLGDNVLQPKTLDMTGLQLDQGRVLGAKVIVIILCFWKTFFKF
jgi:putative protease